ncbi:transposase [Pedobacter sp. V48]|uniref:ISAon1 family transposase n=1 Tax=Pedobacter sp. V48 TaxID=509635 RepID=UPI0003E4B6C8|nr:transposase [Pedobacter sp. V48]ETZ24060.1 hypothetical protein N824_16105 [Pedobacter sp. V48]
MTTYSYLCTNFLFIETRYRPIVKLTASINISSVFLQPTNSLLSRIYCDKVTFVLRIKYRWEAMDAENEAIEQSKKTGRPFQAEVLHNGDTIKQLLARSRYVLYKKPSGWTDSQKDRAELLFERFPDLRIAYGLSMGLSQLFENTTDKVFALANLAKWHEKVRQTGFKAFNTIARSIQNHYQTILNYFDNRSTNASVESFNAKIKAFRSQFRGVKNIEFFLYRLTQLYA